MASRERGLSAVTVNTWSKAVNAFLGWLHAEGHLPERREIARLKTEKRVLVLLTTDQLKRLIAFKPKTIESWRSSALAQTLLDTGIRIDEALRLRPADVDFDNLLLKVRGKGRKERVVPFSLELRRVLYRWSQLRERHEWLVGLAVRFSFHPLALAATVSLFGDVLPRCSPGKSQRCSQPACDTPTFG